MPGTPSVREPAVPVDDNPAGLVHSSCPPEDERDDSWIQAQIRLNAEAERPVAPSSLPTPPSTSSPQNTTPAETPIPSPNIKMDIEIESKPDGMMSPVSIGGASKPESETGEVKTPTQAQPLALNNYAAGSSSSMEYEFSNIRLLPSSPSSFLRPGSKFTGIQKSDKNEYNVEVDIKQVDWRESSICGFLKIEGLTKDHPCLTTFFEGEVIGTKYTFKTKHPDWGANDIGDLAHWMIFDDFAADYSSAVQKGNYKVRNNAQQRIIYMRWKELFLVPDHRVRTIDGASFEGFYYIAFDQVTGAIEGTYFHAKSERFQRLHLKRVEDRGCLPAMELR